MAHVNFNHLNASAFNSFVPVATKTANNQLFKNVLAYDLKDNPNYKEQAIKKEPNELLRG